MGELANTAKKNSNFLKLEKGETAIVTYLSFRVVPSSMDPTKDTVQYKFATEHGDKFWTNGNSGIMMFFDDLKGGETIAIKRDAWINKDKSEDTSKSSYKVTLVDNKIGQNPGNVINPEDIAWEE